MYWNHTSSMMRSAARLLLPGPAQTRPPHRRTSFAVRSAAAASSSALCDDGQTPLNRCPRCFGTTAAASVRRKSRSPYTVLQVGRDATDAEIKAAFRELAKRHHPDLRAHHQKRNNDNAAGDHDDDSRNDTMAGLIDAYETLMRKNDARFLTDARDSRVALACEMYTVDELRGMKGTFDVHAFRVRFVDEDGEGEPRAGEGGTERRGEARSIGDRGRGERVDLDAAPTVPLAAHPDDSVLDLKRRIQSRYAESWGIDGRRVDRDGLHLGWELVHRHGGGGRGGGSDGDCGMNGDGSSVLSYHLFLSDYGIVEDDLLYAVVRGED